MSRQFENLNGAKAIIDDSKALASFHDRFEKSTRKGNDGRIDKFKKGFNVDDRFKVFETRVWFTAYTGSYGSSPISNYLTIRDNKSASEALIQYLQENEEDIIAGISKILSEKAKVLIDAAKSEVSAASAIIADIESSTKVEDKS